MGSYHGVNSLSLIIPILIFVILNQEYAFIYPEEIFILFKWIFQFLFVLEFILSQNLSCQILCIRIWMIIWCWVWMKAGVHRDRLIIYRLLLAFEFDLCYFVFLLILPINVNVLANKFLFLINWMRINLFFKKY